MSRVVWISGLVCLGLTACAPTLPDSAAGISDVGLRPAAPVQTAALEPAQQGSLPQSVLDAVDDTAEAREAARVRAANSGVAPVQASPSNPAPVQVNNPGISSEQDFGVVSGQRSIESDAQRLAANRAQYTVLSPTSLPARGETEQPNIVQYALRTNNPVGVQIYRRSRFRSERNNGACNRFASPDQAQIAFLADGGPQRDKQGLDPDGDGFACNWDPTPFRRIGSSAPTPTRIIEPLAISTE